MGADDLYLMGHIIQLIANVGNVTEKEKFKLTPRREGMKIMEALEKNGKARRQCWNDATYLVKEEHIDMMDGYTFTQYYADGGLPVRGYRMFASEVLATDWLPYSPEPEKCRACKEADELQFNPASMPVSADHLRRYHCTCKKEAP